MATSIAIALGAILLATLAAYTARRLLFMRAVDRAIRAWRAGDLERAREVLAPVLQRYPQIPSVQRASGLILYALGDPLSAASLLERASRSFGGDLPLAVTLVASYAALNRAGDARRASALAPKDPDVRLALAWSELVALGGDRSAGTAMSAELSSRADVQRDPARRAMAAALTAIAAARSASEPEVDAALSQLRMDVVRLPAYERCFLGYLEGVALREAARRSDALAAFERAMEVAPTTIGEALARREHANMRSSLAPYSSSGRSSTD